MPNTELFLPRFLFGTMIFAILLHSLGVRPYKSLPLSQTLPEHYVTLFVAFCLIGLLADIVDYGRRRWNDESERGYLKAQLGLGLLAFALLFYLLKMIVAPKWYEPWW